LVTEDDDFDADDLDEKYASKYDTKSSASTKAVRGPVSNKKHLSLF